MTRRAAFVVFAAAFTPLFQAAPLNERGLSASRTLFSTSTSAPLPSATQQNLNTTSTPTPNPVPNWAAYANGTIGFALHRILTVIAPDAPQRWVTAEIASTQIASDDPAGSNADLSKAVDTSFGVEWSHQTWVDTYTDFLSEAGNSSLTADVEKVSNDWLNASAKWSAEQVKLVRAYEAAHPGNVTYVGIDIANISRVDGIDMGIMMAWGEAGGDGNCTRGAEGNVTSSGGNSTSHPYTSSSNHTSKRSENCTSDSSYTTDDYKHFLSVASTHGVLAIEIVGFNTQQQMVLYAHQFKNTLSQFGIFNLSMVTGGGGTYAQFAPAWTATIIGLSTVSWDVQNAVDSHLKEGPGESTDNNTIVVPGIMKRSGATQGFGALQFIAHGMNSTAPKSGSTTAPKSALVAAAAAAAAPAVDPDPLNQPLTADQILVLLSVQEGTWAANRGEFIEFTRQNYPAIVDKYFGPDGSGSGPIGRRWTHLVLRIGFDLVNGSTRVGSVDLLGKVYEVLPVVYQLAS
ncbi:hypothetical protein DFH09DRAFT_1361908 [Mycena vulgaris]|nr:hypothetical protein DFH09DRAFT_1361908 [Mycena vulgaris]